jgi:signal transduction histidine kinase/ActR/RegA family two-component response regulator
MQFDKTSEGTVVSATAPSAFSRWMESVDAQLLHSLISVVPVVTLLSSAGAVIMAVGYASVLSVPRWAPWLALFLMVSGCRIILSRSQLRSATTPINLRRRLISVCGLSSLHGALWGSASLLLVTPQHVEPEALLHITLGAVAMGAAVHLAAFYPALVAFVVLSLLPLIARDVWLAQGAGRGSYGLLAVMTAFIGMFALLIGRRQYASVQELVRQRRETIAANQTKARFLAAASHDLRQPMQAMALLAQTLGSHSSDTEVQRVSGQLLDGVAQMGLIVDELMTMSHIDAGQQHVQLRALPLSPLLQGLVALHEPQARAKGLQLQLESPPDLWVCSDEHHLRRVLDNLLTNAVRYTDYGEIVLRAQPEGTALSIQVQDSGIGIAAEELPRVFEEFYQVGNPGRAARHGHGLGLAIVRRLSDLLGLDLRVKSTLGQGSCFSLTLPLIAATESTVPAAAVSTRGIVHGHRVLCIEDDPLQALALRQLLRQWGCDVRVAASQRAAFAELDSGFKPQALISDLRLADGEDGCRTVWALRERTGEVLPALIVTGDVGSDAARHAASTGLPLMAKPVKPAKLRAFVQHAAATASVPLRPAQSLGAMSPHPANARRH